MLFMTFNDTNQTNILKCLFLYVKLGEAAREKIITSISLLILACECIREDLSTSN